MNDKQQNTPNFFTRSKLMELADAEPGLAKSVDADIRGTPITDYKVLLVGAYGPAVERIVNLAVERHGDQAPAPITHEQLLALAPDAIAQETDYYFKTTSQPEPQAIRDYGMILDKKEYNYHTHLLALTNLALQKWAER